MLYHIALSVTEENHRFFSQDSRWPVRLDCQESQYNDDDDDDDEDGDYNIGYYWSK
jgi:hypothetical protein